jgi:hypothetical protein
VGTDGISVGGLHAALVRNCNGLNVMVLQLGVVLPGDPRYEGVEHAMQEKHHQILPGLISLLH